MDRGSLENLVRFFGTVHVQDIEPSTWREFRQDLPDGLQTSYSDEYVKDTGARAFDKIPPEAYKFLEAVKHLEFRRDYASTLVRFEEWWRGFTSKAVIAKVMYAAERYDLVDKLFIRGVGDDSDLPSVQHIWFDSISRIGDYNFKALLATPRTVNDLISYLRYCWQNGAFSRCQEVCKALDSAQLTDEEQARYLNNKARVLRDTGRIIESRGALEEYAKCIVRLQAAGADIAFVESRRATYEYNMAIDAFIGGKLRLSIALCQRSLTNRQDQYPRPYLLLRMARASILIGNSDEADLYIEAADKLEIDKWGTALLWSVKAEREFFLRRDIEKAHKFWERAHQQEQSSGSTFLYADLGLSLCAVAEGASPLLLHYRERMAKSDIVDGKICYDTIKIAERLLLTDDYNLQESIASLFDRFGEYKTWLFLWLFALAFLLTRLGRQQAWAKGTYARFLDTDCNLESFGAIENIKAPQVFISYSYDSESHRKWCLRLHRKLRENGVDAIIDQAYRGVTTVDFNSFMIKGIRDSDLIVVILTPGYKAKIESDIGGAFVEFGLLRDEIIRKDYKRIIFVLRLGDFASTIPFEARGVEQLDFRQEELDWQDASEAFRTLLHRIFRIPIYRQVPLGNAPILRPQSE